jgi:hypothetical protein
LFVPALIAYLVFHQAGAVAVATLGGIMLAIFSVASVSFWEAFSLTAWFYFFREITFIKSEESVKQKEVVVIDVPASEAV